MRKEGGALHSGGKRAAAAATHRLSIQSAPAPQRRSSSRGITLFAAKRERFCARHVPVGTSTAGTWSAHTCTRVL